MNIRDAIQNQVKEVQALEKELGILDKQETGNNEDTLKYKYRLEILNLAIKQAKHIYNTHATSILSSLIAVFDLAIKTAFPELKNQHVMLNPCGNPKFGDYQCNSSLSMSKILEKQGVTKNPREIAELIVANVIDCGVIEKCEVAPTGFINIFISRQFVAGEISKIINIGVLPPKIATKRVIVDYSSPNIAKEMHVGHLRSTIIGDSISRLLRFLGYNVLAINHIGDWGTQFGMLIAHLRDIYPNYLIESPPIGDLASFYKDAKKRFDEEPEFKARAYESVVLLQSHDEDSLKAWHLICDVSRREFQKIYIRLGIKELHERGESFYQQQMEELVAELEKQGFLEIEEGRKILRSDFETYMLMVKSDGGFTYDTSDMAAIKYRMEVDRADSIIYVVDNGQANHFEGLFAAARRVGIYNPLKHDVRFVGFGVVLGADRKKFKSRANETVRLADLLDEGLSRSLAKLKEKGRDQELTAEELEAAQKAVAYGCIKYADLSSHRMKEYIFSFDKMLQDKGNTAVYLLYAYTRISGISRTAGVSQDDLRLWLYTNQLTFDHEREWKLAKVLTRLPEVLLKMADDLLPHLLCDYLYDVCCIFSEFYEACYCVEKDAQSGKINRVNMWRIALVEATVQVLRTGFDILGLEPVKKM